MANRLYVERSSLHLIEDFLAQKRIAMVGISHNSTDFSVGLFRELCRRGYDIVPVNPHMREIMGRKCFAALQDIEPPVDAALLMTSPATTDAVVRDCAEAGIRRVWMYRAGTHGGAVSEPAIQFCRERGIQVIPGECPLMFLPQGGIHRVHGFFRKLTGRYPKRAQA